MGNAIKTFSEYYKIINAHAELKNMSRESFEKFIKYLSADTKNISTHTGEQNGE